MEIAAGRGDDRIVIDVVMHDGAPGIRVLAIGPKYAGRGSRRETWVYNQADRRRRQPYPVMRGGDAR